MNSETEVEIRLLTPDMAEKLGAFFDALTCSGDICHFHPHPLNAEFAGKLAHHSGQDLYYVMVEGERILGYGMLRGWDEGYRVPSLGIAIHPAERGRGLGKRMMRFLHSVAQQHGATQIRLKVHSDNLQAITLYQHLGYQFQGEESGQIVGMCAL